MHELSIALSMLEQVAVEVDKLGGAKVDVVYVKIGVMSGIDCQALQFAYEIAIAGTQFAESRLEIESVPLLVFCPQCKQRHSPATTEVYCPRCVTAEQKILQGRELEVSALEIMS